MEVHAEGRGDQPEEAQVGGQGGDLGAPGQLAQPGGAFRTERTREPDVPRARPRGPAPVQGGRRSLVGAPSLPMGLRMSFVAHGPFVVREDLVGRQLHARVGLAAAQLLVDGAQRVVEERGRPRIGDDVMLVEIPAAALGAQLDEGGVEETCVQVERLRAPLVGPAREGGFGILLLREVENGQRELERPADVLVRHAFLDGDDRAERVAAFDQPREGRAEDLRVDRPVDHPGEGHVVEGRVGMELLPHPEPPLGRREVGPGEHVPRRTGGHLRRPGRGGTRPWRRPCRSSRW